MSDDYKPKHLRSLPPGVDLTPEEEREHMDLQTDLDRVRRKHLSEHAQGEEPWDFPVPHAMARLFDRLPSSFTTQEAKDAGEGLNLDADAVREALREMREHELVSATADGFVKHPEAKNWF